MVALITFIAFTPALWHPFVEWDDVTFIAGNPRFNPPTWETITFYLRHPGENLYMPVTYCLWTGLAWLGHLAVSDAMGSRLNPYLFHLVSVLLHMLAATAVYLLLRPMVRSTAAAVIGALLFALHPLQVESIAFIGTMNTPLAGALGLWAIWFYLQSREVNSIWIRWQRLDFLLATLLLIAALLSKPTAVVIPLIALLLDANATGAAKWKHISISILPWMLLAIGCTAWARHIQPAGEISSTPAWFHPFVAMDASAFYFWKLIWPVQLGIDYGRTPQMLARQNWMLECIAIVAVFGVIIVANLWSTRGRIAFAILLALCGLLPNSGLISFDYQQFSTVADRYVYLAMLGVALAMATLLDVAARRNGIYKKAGFTIAIAMLMIFLVQTQRQIQIWSDGTTLFRHTIAINPDSWMSYTNLANIEADRDPDQALSDCRSALKIKPDNAIAWNTLGTILIARGEREAAIQAFDRAHQLSPGFGMYAANAARARAAAHIE